MYGKHRKTFVPFAFRSSQQALPSLRPRMRRLLRSLSFRRMAGAWRLSRRNRAIDRKSGCARSIPWMPNPYQEREEFKGFLSGLRIVAISASLPMADYRPLNSLVVLYRRFAVSSRVLREAGVASARLSFFALVGAVVKAASIVCPTEEESR